MCDFVGSMITGTFQGELEIDKGVGLKCRVKRVVKRLSHNVTEVKSEGVQI